MTNTFIEILPCWCENGLDVQGYYGARPIRMLSALTWYCGYLPTLIQPHVSKGKKVWHQRAIEEWARDLKSQCSGEFVAAEAFDLKHVWRHGIGFVGLGFWGKCGRKGSWSMVGLDVYRGYGILKIMGTSEAKQLDICMIYQQKQKSEQPENDGQILGLYESWSNSDTSMFWWLIFIKKRSKACPELSTWSYIWCIWLDKKKSSSCLPSPTSKIFKNGTSRHIMVNFLPTYCKNCTILFYRLGFLDWSFFVGRLNQPPSWEASRSLNRLRMNIW